MAEHTDPAPDTVDGAFAVAMDAAFPGLPHGLSWAEAERRVAAAIAALAERGWGDVADLRAQVATLTAERDEALAARDEHRAREALLDDLNEKLHALCRRTADERDESHHQQSKLAAELAERTRERDDARGLLAKLGKDYDRLAAEQPDTGAQGTDAIQDRTGALETAIEAGLAEVGNMLASVPLDGEEHTLADHVRAAVRAAAPHIQREALLAAAHDMCGDGGPDIAGHCGASAWLTARASSLIPDPAGSQDETGEDE